MKSIFLIFISLILFACCKKKENSPYLGEVTFLMNGVNYAGTLTVSSNDSTFTFSLYNKINGINHDNFGFGFVRKTLLKQSAKNRTTGLGIPDFSTCSYGTRQDDGDVVCELFKVYEPDSVTNYIQVTNQDNNFKEVWGVFNVTLYKAESCPEKNSGDTLRCTNGKFHILLN